MLDEALRSAPRPQPPFRPRSTVCAQTGPRRSAGGPRQERLLPCPSMNSGCRPSSFARSPHEGYTEPTPVQPEAIPLVLERPRPARRRPDRHRQDGRLRAADPPAPRTPAAPRGPPQSIRALVLAPTRELALQVEESVRTYGQQQPIKSTAIYGGVGFDPQVRKPATRPRDRRRHARPAARPRRPAHDRPVARRDPRPRRGRPDARHGLHPRHPQDHRPAAAAPAEPDVLGHVLGRHPAARRRHPPRARPASRSRRATPRPSWSSRSSSPSTASASASCSATSSSPAGIDQALVFTRTKHGANRLAAAARAWTASPPPRSTATRASRSASARWPTSRTTGAPSWSRPRSPRAASTSTRCPTS